MTQKILSAKTTMLLATLFISIAAYCQLPDFTLTAVPTPQTCPGNGSLALSVSGVNPAASMSYVIYLLPNETQPITVVNAGPVLSLAAGTYKIVATQSLAPNTPVTKTATVTIADNFVPLDYSSTPENVKCGNDGRITVNNLSGTIVSYSLVAPSPVIVGPQASNVFNNLPAGSYRVQVVTSCGETRNFDRIVGTTNSSMVVDLPSFDDGELPTCNTITVMHFYGALTGSQVLYPLIFTFTVTPPGGGAPVVITQTVQSGANTGEVSANIPFYNNVQYTYSLTVANACGITTTRPLNVVNRKFDTSIVTDVVNCVDNTFSIKPKFFKPPYSLAITGPPTFNPANYYPQQVFNGPVTYGAANNPVPEGNYTLVATDNCGRQVTTHFTISDPDVEPVVSGYVNGCSPTGTLEATISGGRNLVKVVIKVAPNNYPVLTPHDVSSSIGAQGFERGNMLVGYYELEITDSCGETYIKPFTLAAVAANPDLVVQQRPGCDVDMGSVRISIGPDSTFTLVRITEAPDDFPHDLPYIATSFAVGNNIYMNSLPKGTYTFETMDSCGASRSKQFEVEGYNASLTGNFTVIPRCGSFNIDLHHTSNGIFVPSFWLQKFNTATNTWGHPATGVAYPANTLPSPANSVPLTNNQVNVYFPYVGQFRIIKAFYTYSNASAANNRCVVPVGEPFMYDGNPKINSVHPFPCSGGLTEVAVEAVGAEPLKYEIISKNGNTSFTVNNGTSPLFTGLEPATYVFRVTDDCGNSFPYPATINELDPLVVTATGFCEGENSTLSVQQFSFLNYEWYEAGAPTTILSTQSTLTFPSFSTATDAGTYYVRIISSTANSCLNQTLPPYVINGNALPNAGANNAAGLCNNGDVIDLTTHLSNPHDAGGAWQLVSGTGQLNGSLFATAGLAAGAYQFKYTVTGQCSLTDEALITITLKDKPLAPVPGPVTPVCGTGIINLNVAAVAGATSYNWTGPNNFTSSVQNPVINNAGSEAAGVYNVTVTVNGCTSPAAQVTAQVTPLPLYHLESSTSQICAGQSSIITVVPDGGGVNHVVQAWYHESELIPGVTSLSIEAFEPGFYEVEVSNGICIGARQGFTLSEGSIAADVVLEGGCDNNENYVLYVVNTADFPGATYAWTGPDNYSATGDKAVITGWAAGEYTVTVNLEGCEKPQPINILNTFCEVPRGISPNGDDYNNDFDLTNLDVKEISIFNRYGMKVYDKENYKDEWHGQSYLGDLPTGTYYYVLRLATGKQMTGWVYLLREL